MKLEINIGNRGAMIISAVIVAIFVVGLAGAFGGSSPSTMGHSVGEIDWSGTIPSMSVNNLGVTTITGANSVTSNQFCIGGSCKTSWGYSPTISSEFVCTHAGDYSCGISGSWDVCFLTNNYDPSSGSSFDANAGCAVENMPLLGWILSVFNPNGSHQWTCAARCIKF